MLSLLAFWSTVVSVASSVTITDIQGPAFQSSLIGQTVTNLSALVTAKGSSGFYLAGEPIDDIRVSNGLFVFSSSATILAQVHPGDFVSLSGKVSEFRASTRPNDLFLTELVSPTNITVLSSNNTVTPVVLGKGGKRSPPTQQLSAQDVGRDGFLSVPNNSSRIEVTNATLQPHKFGMDFWESLEGQLVSIRKPVALDFQNSFGEFWIRGDWPVTGKNGRGGLSITFGLDGLPDANPETIIVGSPLDGSKNPQVAIGVGLSDIVGVVHYQFGFYYVLPTTAPTVISTQNATVTPTKIISHAVEPCGLTIGDYNVENMAPTSTHIPKVADHISTYLRTPDIMFIQEIQDNSGPKDDGVVDANLTLTALVTAIANASGVNYSFIDIAPVNNQDGGQPGGNIRQAYLYRPEKLKLAPAPAVGGSLDEVEVLGKAGRLSLNFNPGRIDPMNGAWNASRKPLVAHWRTASAHDLFTVNLHLSSKGGSSSTQGDARPPVNLPIDARTSQVNLVSAFVKSILDNDRHANIIVAGDYNEFVQTRSVFASLDPLLNDIDEVAGIPPVERYTYVFDQNTEQLDHVFISDALSRRKVLAEHIHVNNWAPTLSARVSDHDPTVGKVQLC